MTEADDIDVAYSRQHRKREIILPPEVVGALSSWHSGMDAIYSLSSYGAEHLVSLRMIDAALDLLERELPKVKNRADRKHLKDLIGELEMIRMSPREFSADEAGMGMEEDEYKYDPEPNRRKRGSRRPKKRTSRRRR